VPRPARPKIYHIVHVDRLRSIIEDDNLWSDAVLAANPRAGTTIGMTSIKARRLYELRLTSHPDLFVGQCVPFYFCPRSIMLYLIHCANHPELTYRGGQEAIIHLECDLFDSVTWCSEHNHRWAFTLSNAGAYYFEDRSDIAQLDEINWDAVAARHWSGTGIPTEVKEGKQAEFLVEQSFPWRLVERIGVCSMSTARRVIAQLQRSAHRPAIEILPHWYY
jgi:ssDNA thymidine ADP-ribosyltransferase, DarT